MTVTDPVASTPGEIAAATFYGATISGVGAYLPNRQFTDSSNPNVNQVQQYIADVTSQVALTIGDLDRLSGAFLTNVLGQAKMVVQLGAAAWAQDAAYPERADPQNRTGWGQILWERFNMLLQQLAVTVSRGPATPDEGPFYPDIGVAWQKPLDPLIANVGGIISQDWADPYAYPDNQTDEVQTEIDETSGWGTNYSQGGGGDGTHEDIG